MAGCGRIAGILSVLLGLVPYHAQNSTDNVSDDHLAGLGVDEPVADLLYPLQKPSNIRPPKFGYDAEEEVGGCDGTWSGILDLSPLEQPSTC